MIPCVMCGGKMAKRIKKAHSYVELGLAHVTLHDVPEWVCKKCGDVALEIFAIERLHRSIALALVGKRSLLLPCEISFLRKNLGWSGVKFAKNLGVTKETISRWENGHEPTSGVADRLLRMYSLLTSPDHNYSADDMAGIEKVATVVRVDFVNRKGLWRVAS